MLLNGCMLLLAVPLHVVFCKYLWDRQPQSVLLLVALCPLAVLALLFGQHEAIQYLAVSGVVMALLQIFSMRHNRRVGMKVV